MGTEKLGLVSLPEITAEEHFVLFFGRTADEFSPEGDGPAQAIGLGDSQALVMVGKPFLVQRSGRANIHADITLGAHFFRERRVGRNFEVCQHSAEQNPAAQTRMDD